MPDQWFKIESANGTVRMLNLPGRDIAKAYARPGEKVWSWWDARWRELPSPWPEYAFHAN